VEKALTFSEETLSSFDSTLQARFRAMGIPEAVMKASVEYGESVGKHIVAWTGKDNYKQSRTFPRYTVTYQPGTWAPTPPAYADALEPHWNKIRPFTLDSAAQFKPVRPAPFDSTPGSEFMKLVTDVYETSQKLSEEQKTIAMFWDNNAFAPNVIGHLTFASKKVTPGGHWINIAMQVTRKEKSNLIQTAEAAALTAIAVQDGFISCWDEKYRSVYIRPETVINKYVDEVWRPFIQTPPFPEYTSGHSVISGAASVALSSLFGDTYAFVDSTEYDAGLTPRSFKSFGEAASEASVSRLYGGIHFRPALDIGSQQGNNVGQWVLSQVKTRK
ncbi:MAG: phosphatase PAP2 family protein, partial [Bacteroidetes bacterium]